MSETGFRELREGPRLLPPPAAQLPALCGRAPCAALTRLPGRCGRRLPFITEPLCSRRDPSKPLSVPHTPGAGAGGLSASAGLVLYHLPSPTGPIDMQCEPRGGRQLEGTLRGVRPCPAVQQAAALPSCQAWSWGSGNKSEAALVWEDGQSCTGKPAPPADGQGWGVSRWGETALSCRAGGSGPAALRPSG